MKPPAGQLNLNTLIAFVILAVLGWIGKAVVETRDATRTHEIRIHIAEQDLAELQKKQP
jgi:hypothetical protein